MKLRLAPAAVLLIALAGCGGSGGSKTASIPAGGGAQATSPATTTAAAPGAGCKVVKAPQPRPNGKLTKPTTKLDAGKTWTATVATNCGTFAFKLDVRQAPNATSSIAYLAGRKFYDHTVFHRIVPCFVIQG